MNFIVAFSMVMITADFDALRFSSIVITPVMPLKFFVAAIASRSFRPRA